MNQILITYTDNTIMANILSDGVIQEQHLLSNITDTVNSLAALEYLAAYCRNKTEYPDASR